jgi:hypothetical protein
MEYEVTERALQAFISYAKRELEIDATESTVTAFADDDANHSLLDVARAANLASLHLKSLKLI